MRAEPEILELPMSAIMSLSASNEVAVVESAPAVRPVDLDSEEVGLDSDVSMPGGPAMALSTIPPGAAPLVSSQEPKLPPSAAAALSVNALRELVATEDASAYGPGTPGAPLPSTPSRPERTGGIQLTASTLIIFGVALLVLGAVAGVLIMRFAK